MKLIILLVASVIGLFLVWKLFRRLDTAICRPFLLSPSSKLDAFVYRYLKDYEEYTESNLTEIIKAHSSIPQSEIEQHLESEPWTTSNHYLSAAEWAAKVIVPELLTHDDLIIDLLEKHDCRNEYNNSPEDLLEDYWYFEDHFPSNSDRSPELYSAELNLYMFPKRELPKIELISPFVEYFIQNDFEIALDQIPDYCWAGYQDWQVNIAKNQ